MEYKNSLQYNDIRGIDLGIDFKYQLLSRRNQRYLPIGKGKIMAHMKPIYSKIAKVSV